MISLGFSLGLTVSYLPQQTEGMVSTTKATHDTRISVRIRQKKRYAPLEELGSPSAFHTCVCVCVCVCGVCMIATSTPHAHAAERNAGADTTRHATAPDHAQDTTCCRAICPWRITCVHGDTLEQDKKNTTTKLNNTKQLQCKTNQADVHARTPVASASWIETRLPFVKETHGSWANRRDTALPLFDIFVFRCRLAPPGLTLSGDAASFVFRRALGRATLKRQGRCSSRNFSGPPSLPQR